MPLIKLDAIDSTNDFLKQLVKESAVENFTIVIAKEQTKGKGQMGAKWISEPGKNLTMSVLVKDVQLTNQSVFDFNIAVALSIVDALKKMEFPNISIKWPNDIMSDSKKVSGVLIENIFKHDGNFNSVVGIGLNVNQTNFKDLPQATSLKCITGKDYDLEEIALLLSDSLQGFMQVLAKHREILWDFYHQNLYKLNYPSPFEDKNGNRFMGIIKKVTRDGKLEVLLDNDTVTHYDVKEIKMLF
ncbi:biotin--[acetyl-CoA-carboxylase] ligase [Flavobacterium sp. AS60]|uniref:biotin--[acetyl-CoA-carboxylase] ligase n=1 Tax=Flavobacterium anseongense TaxID=2910677 RepID=UPI001F416DD3|nr:biotin--[acetyl-CoA-carboxylase] ligase [Flavobacterium sp. AS60]MCF6129960.1 biotin--[acetyl-CoA-carboxylase] ligase [Flavobacterium sp. AS60]